MATRAMQLPFDRDALRERNRRDDREAARAAAAVTADERLAHALELSDVVRALARSVGARWVTAPSSTADHSSDRQERQASHA